MIAGIDLGTTNSLIGIWRDGRAQLAGNALGETLLPSVVSFDEDGTVYVGQTARERLVTHPDTTFAEFKRDMGSSMRYTAHGKTYTPIDLSAIVLKQLKADAEAYFGEEITEAIISVPAYFDDKQRAATRNAGLLAGLKVSRLINEPSAAALSYHIDHMEESETYVVFDFGGGTLDATVVETFSNVIEIRTISGDNRLGGKDFNELIVQDMCKQNGPAYTSLTPGEQALMLRVAEEIKILLTDQPEAAKTYRLRDKTYEYRLDEQHLIDISSDLFRRLTIVLKRLMNDAEVSMEDIAGVILVGGSSKMPIVRHFVGSLFPGKLMPHTNPDEIVARGAASFAGIKERREGVKDMVLIDVCPFTLGVTVVDDRMAPVLPKNTSLPASREEYFHTVFDDQRVVRIEVRQGEHMRASENLLLDEITINIPPLPRGRVGFIVRYSYDINGIFDVDIMNPNFAVDVHRKMGDTGGLSEEEVSERQKSLNALKIHPRDAEENRYLIARALRLYEECNPAQRVALERELALFDAALDTQDPRVVNKSYIRFLAVLSRLEQTMFAFSDYDADMWSEYLNEQTGVTDEAVAYGEDADD